MATALDSNFAWPPLLNTSSQIRLLRLLAANEGDGQDVLRCELTVHDLASVESRYNAISYTWGTDDAERDIVVNGSPARATHNCWYALRQMRAYDTETWYWIDSLCINQSDNTEKGQQIKLMSSIYRKAAIVTICLGEPGPDEIIFSGDWISEDWREDCFVDGIRVGFMDQLLAMAHFKERPYFKRLWVIQEFMIPRPRSLVVFCGHRHLPWNTLQRRCIAWTEGENPFDIGDFLSNRRLRQPNFLLYDLYDAVRLWSKKQCREPRDKVFGLLAMVKPWQAANVQVDYSVPLLHLVLHFTSICCRMVLHSRPASIVARRHFPEDDSIYLLLNEFALACTRFRQDLQLFFRHHWLELTCNASSRANGGIRSEIWSNICQCDSTRTSSHHWENMMEEHNLYEGHSPCELVLLSFLKRLKMLDRSMVESSPDGWRAVQCVLSDAELLQYTESVIERYWRSHYPEACVPRDDEPKLRLQFAQSNIVNPLSWMIRLLRTLSKEDTTRELTLAAQTFQDPSDRHRDD